MLLRDWARVKTIVAGALTRPDADREVYFTDQCGSDQALRREVESLVAAAVHAATLYETPTLLVGGDTFTFEALAHLPAEPPALLYADGSTGPLVPTRGDFEGTQRYAVCRRIGVGGMGVVYEVHDRSRGQRVALKTLLRWHSDDIYRLKQEFRSLADIAHPNLAALYDLVVDEGQCFFTMELVDGGSFVDYVRANGTADFDRARNALSGLIEGVQELHRRAKLHRDIKPSNVLLSPEGRAVILDFGLTASRAGDAWQERGLLGTPAYLSPEESTGNEAGEAGDWYSVGATLYHALTGRVPFEGTLTEVIQQKTSADPIAVTALAPGVPDDLADVCMALLSRDPFARLSGLEAFRRERPVASPVAPDGLRPAGSVFVGREQLFDSLTVAFDAVKAGGNRSVYVHGPSGIGKTALVQHFFDRHIRSQRCLALRSRCHEHESVPYKGLDGVIDGLSRYLSKLPHEELARVMPADGAALARLFPVMERATGSASLPLADQADLLAIRRRAFAALRDLLRTLATRAPLVIEIDDFHWADADSAASIAALVRAPESPSMLLVLSFRSEEIDTKPFLRSLVDQADMWTRVSLPVTPLSDAEAAELISTLLPDRPVADLQRYDIAREAKGNPFLVEELVRSVALGGAARSGTPLGEILERRLAGLPPESRVFLETLAVCGRPILAARISEACGLSGDERPLVARLRAAHFLRRSRSPEHVEIYHDRLRETLAASVSKETASRIHVLMAEILVAHGDEDPEALFEHYRAAGRAALAARQAAAAAQRASAVLAFDGAASFFREALELDPGADQHLAWRLGLAVALENAGRPAQAADAYLTAAREADESRQVEWQRKAAELLLMGGHIDRGLETIGTVLPVVGVRLARGPRSALGSILLGRARLAWRGLDFEARDESAIPPNTLLCIDTCWAVSTGLMLVDTLRAASVELRHLRIALDAGEPYRVARALALEACLSAARGGREGIARSAAFAARAQAVAEGVSHPHVLALSSLTAGVAAFVLGEWVKATELCERALTMLRDECRGVVWELTLAQNFYLGSLFYRGHIRRVSQWIPGLLESARDRGNLYFETELTTRFGMVWLAADDPDAGERQADDANARWSADGFHRQHYNHLQARVHTALYRGRAADAWRLAQQQVTSVRRNWWLRVQLMRIETAYLRARCALAVAAEGRDAARMLAVAARDADRLAREDTRWSNPLALLVRATVAHLRGQENVAAARLSDAVEAFGAADMRLYEAVARRRLGILVGGERGRARQREAEDWLAAEAIRNPAAMSRLLAPGLPER